MCVIFVLVYVTKLRTTLTMAENIHQEVKYGDILKNVTIRLIIFMIHYQEITQY